MSKEAEKLADSMDDEIAQAGRVSNHNGMLAAALLRGQAEQIKELREALARLVHALDRGDLLHGDQRAAFDAAAAISNTKDQ